MENRPSFHYIRKQLIMSGILELPNVSKIKKNIITYLSLVMVSFCFISALLYLLIEDKPILEKSESILNTIGITHVLSKTIILPLNRKKLVTVMSEMDEMTTKSDQEEGLKKEYRRNLLLSRRIPETVILSLSLLAVIGTIVCFIRYSTFGVVSPPLQLYVPFRSGHFFLTVFYNCSLLVFPTCCYAVQVSTIISLSLNISCQLSYLARKLELLGVDPIPEDIDSCIALHQKILRVVKNVNEIISGLLFFEYLLTSLQCCFAAYQLLGDKKNDSTAILLYRCTFFAISLICSSLNCICGNLIKLKSEDIFVASYYNKWYKMSATERKKLFVIMLISSKDLSLSYRRIITFDLALYGTILKGAYSLVTALQTMDVG